MNSFDEKLKYFSKFTIFTEKKTINTTCVYKSFLLSGLGLYFSYGMKHSSTSKSVTNKRRFQGASRPIVDSTDLLSSTQHRRERPNSLMLSPVPISSIPTDIDGGATSYSTPTFDLTTLNKNSDRLGIFTRGAQYIIDFASQFSKALFFIMRPMSIF